MRKPASKQGSRLNPAIPNRSFHVVEWELVMKTLLSPASSKHRLTWSSTSCEANQRRRRVNPAFSDPIRQLKGCEHSATRFRDRRVFEE